VSFLVVIPARYASTRLPGKVLLDIAGKPMVQHVHENAARSGAARILVATDDERVAAAVRGFGAEVMMTSPAHRSGTERCAEVVARLGLAADTTVVNVQGDEPLMPGSLMRQVADGLAEHPAAHVATLCEPIVTEAMLFDPNAVKVVMNRVGRALYFTRAPVPWYRDDFGAGRRAPRPLHHRHVGLYAYRAEYVERYVRMEPSALELAESLEQLRVLDAGDYVHVALAAAEPGPGVDTAADLEHARRLLVSRT
jgi:3-deoxy-manno-octulosonate cytidylyltransferase (CMP-KDO synthetase)